MGGRKMTLITKRATAAVSPSNDDYPGEFDIILSNATCDRDGDVLRPDQWVQPLPESIPISVDHSASVTDVIGSGRPFIDQDGNLRVKGTFASSPAAQHVRSLVAEGHVRSVSVEFVRRKGGNELIGGAFVNVKSNTEARVLSAKSRVFGAAVNAVVVEGKSAEDAGNAMLQAIHDASVHLGADRIGLDDDLTEDGEAGEADGANKAAALKLRLKALSRT